MKGSSRQKHEDNYWKVLQCLGETGSDTFIKALVRVDRASCKCHINSNMYILMQIFVEMQNSVAIIKHINLYKDKVVPMLFKALRQREIPELSRKAFISLYRCLLVGKFNMVELYLRHNIFNADYSFTVFPHWRHYITVPRSYMLWHYWEEPILNDASNLAKL